MAHAKQSDLVDLTSLLTNIRALEGLKEKSFGCFYLKGKGILHFHMKQERRFAHVFDGKMWKEVDLPSKLSVKDQKAAFSKIQKTLPLA